MLLPILLIRSLLMSYPSFLIIGTPSPSLFNSLLFQSQSSIHFNNSTYQSL
ncbi:hypothetical protein AAHE18_13G231400 [Arachis hypogaea]